ncbi:MAG: thioredoxin-dependent thiol peroxidase [Maritimibacter sp.]|jgi:thioredoxin-dependent peroxiredoxin
MSSDLIETGALAPEFTLPRDGGELVSLSSLRGKPVVLFFYPKASTPGCTTEACDFTAQIADFEAAGAVVLGISKDSVKRQENFSAKNSLAMPLLSDAEGDTCERYGTWGEKKNYGRTYMGITRTTYLIDAEGKVARVWYKVKVAGHAGEVLDAVRAL